MPNDDYCSENILPSEKITTYANYSTVMLISPHASSSFANSRSCFRSVFPAALLGITSMTPTPVVRRISSYKENWREIVVSYL